MLITCPICKKCHDVDKSLIPPDATMVRCRNCGSRFSLGGTKPEPAATLHMDRPVEQTNGRSAVRTIGVMISKGGVGKTTTAVNLAAGLAAAGRKVLLVDTDTQGQSAYALGVKPRLGLAELVTGEASADACLHQARENLYLLAGGKPLSGIKRMIDRKEFGGELTLNEALSPLAPAYDYVVVDSSPGWDPLTVNVLFFVREILVPVSLEVMPLQGLREFQKSFGAVRQYNKSIHLKYILPTFLDMRIKHPRTILKKLRELYPDEICPPVRYNVRLSEAPAYGMTIFEYAPDSNGAEDYAMIVRRLEQDSQAPETRNDFQSIIVEPTEDDAGLPEDEQMCG